MRKPTFTNMRAGIDGYVPEGSKPSKRNIKAFVRNIALTLHEAREGELDTWDDVLQRTYDQINFFRVYYCGECPSKMPQFEKYYFPKAPEGWKRPRPWEREPKP